MAQSISRLTKYWNNNIQIESKVFYMPREVYLDNSATTRPYDEVIDYINDINRNIYGNPSSLHLKGVESERHLRKARESIASTLDVESREIYFTSGGTEANNLAIRGYLAANPRSGKHIITTRIEHPSVLEVCKHMQEQGYKVDYLDVDQSGTINLDMLENAIGSDTALISIMLVNNEVGAIEPFEQIAAIRNRKNKNTVLHMDAVQAYGKMKLFPKKAGINLLSVSSHKIHGPKGAGALFSDRNLKLKPVLFGGGQESGIRSGTENLTGACGFGMAADITFIRLVESRIKVEKLRNEFVQLLSENVEQFKVLSPQTALPFILNISFPDIKSEVLLHHLADRGVFVSAGSACSSRKNIYSHVLQSMGLCREELEGAVRFSFSSFNSKEDVAYTVEAIKEIIPRIQIKRGGKK